MSIAWIEIMSAGKQHRIDIAIVSIEFTRNQFVRHLSTMQLKAIGKTRIVLERLPEPFAGQRQHIGQHRIRQCLRG